MNTFIVNNADGTTTEWVEIDRGNNEFTSMPKSVYDEMIAKQAEQPIIQDGEDK